MHLELEAEQRLGNAGSAEEARAARPIHFGSGRGRQGRDPRVLGHPLPGDARPGPEVRRAQPAPQPRLHRPWSRSRWASASAPTPRSSAWCAACCCGRCPTRAARRWWRCTSRCRTSGIEDIGFSVKEVQGLRARWRPAWTDVVEYHSMNFTLLGGPEPQRVRTGVVSAAFFDVLGVKPLLGRDVPFGRGRDGRGAAAGAEPRVLAATARRRSQRHRPALRDERPRPHRGRRAAAAAAATRDENDVYMPASACPFRSNPATMENRQARGYQAFARVKPGVPLERAQADVVTVVERLKKEYPDAYPQGLDPSARLVSVRGGDGAGRAPDVAGAAGHGRAGPADRLRERRQPDARPASPTAGARWACARRWAPAARACCASC